MFTSVVFRFARSTRATRPALVVLVLVRGLAVGRGADSVSGVAGAAELRASDRNALLTMPPSLIRARADSLRSAVQTECLQLGRWRASHAVGLDGSGRVQSRRHCGAGTLGAPLQHQRQFLG